MERSGNVLPMADLIAVDDDEVVLGLVVHVLSRAGHKVRAAEDGAALRRLFAERPADLVILDMTLPDEDGLALTRWLRAADAEAGIVFLTGLSDAIDQVAGLEAGADDYVAKPFEPRELLARIEAVLRRRDPQTNPMPRLGPWRIELSAQRLVHEDGRTVRLTGSELRLLLVFARRPGQVLSREELLDLAPGREDETFDRSIDHRIQRLRRRVEPDPKRPSLIRSVRGRGYMYRL